ncbi:HIRAN domain-containing protein [uncultured Bacteroides sp.]|uniref:HIRAN domain-containing protein n=1 Tax=uncultured Bacteroides sp. TaxID=162156 RepID=UPI00262731DC|nr:HIRAN domain-containing protein [uncultured Bacteroides sp.]
MEVLIFIIIIFIVIIVIAKVSDKGDNSSTTTYGKSSDAKQYDDQIIDNTLNRSSRPAHNHQRTESYNESPIQSYSKAPKSGYVVPTIEHLSKRAEERGEDYITEIFFEVKGLYYRGSRAIYEAEQLKKGEVLNLVPEPDNPADKFAIRVHTENGVFIGYVPKECSEELTWNQDKYIDCYVNYVKQGYDTPYVKATARYYGEIFVYGDEYTEVLIHKLKDYMQSAMVLKKQEKWSEAADAFLVAAEKERRLEDKLKAYSEACICLRKLKDYDKETEVINMQLSFYKELSAPKYVELKKRLETAQRFKDSKNRRKTYNGVSKKGKMIAEIIDSLYFHQIKK